MVVEIRVRLIYTVFRINERQQIRILQKGCLSCTKRSRGREIYTKIVISVGTRRINYKVVGVKHRKRV